MDAIFNYLSLHAVFNWTVEKWRTAQ